jgi:uncharacterized repeat protein (TIGR01451 family)
VGGRKGDHTFGDLAFSCVAQRAATGDPDQGRITSRAQELAGPDTVPGGGNPAGYVPCYYEVPAEDIYYVAFYGPRGSASNVENVPSGRIDLNDPRDFDARQNTSVSAWDVTVRSSLSSTADITGRLFADYLAMITGGSSRPVNSTIYALTTDAYIYEVWLRGLDPYGFVLYANNRGFLDSDGETPLYHDVLAQNIPPLRNPQQQNQLNLLQGGVVLTEPTHYIFFNEPSREARTAVNDGLVDPVAPSIDEFFFEGVLGGNATRPGAGGTFVLDPGDFLGIYRLIISRDGVDFDPDNPDNRTLIGVAQAGSQKILWDGLDNATDPPVPFPVGSYRARIELRAGEVHFPLLDVENSLEGGPRYFLTNPPRDRCPMSAGGCFSGFYDDRGYTTIGGTDVGNPGDPGPPPVPPEVLPCPTVNPTCNQPNPDHSNPETGFDTRTDQRAFGDGSEDGFGDKKGLDLWTYYPAEGETDITIEQVVLRIDKDHDIPCYKPGESQIVNYTIDYANAGDEPAVDATVTDTLPEATTFVDCSGGLSCAEEPPGSGVVVYSLGDLAAGETGSLGLAVRVADAATGRLTNTAQLEAVDVPAVETTDELDLCTIRISMSSGCYCPGERERITFNIKYANEGIEPALDATVTDTLPEAMTFVDCSGGLSCAEDPPGSGVVVYSLGTLDPGETGSLGLTVRVADDARGRLTNRARLEAENLDPARATYVPKLCCNGNGNGTIPEPTTLALVGLGLAGLAGYARRRRQRRAD